MKRRYKRYYGWGVWACLWAATLPVAAQQPVRKLSLTEAIEIAKRDSYAAQVARYSFLGQYWNYRSYRAELLPSLNLSGGVMNFDRSIVEVRDADSGRVNYVDNNSLSNDLTLSIDQNIPFLGGTLSLQSSLSRLDQFNYDERTYNSVPLILNYTQPIRAYNALKWRKKTAPLEYEQAQKNYLETMQDITINVTNLFFTVLSAQEDYRQSRADYEDRQRLLDIARKRLDLGTTTKNELLQLELSLLNAKMSVNSTGLALRTQLFDLFSYLRIVDYDGIELLPPYYMPDIEMNAEQVLDKAWAGSSHTLAQRLSLLESERALAEAKAARGLQVELRGRLGLSQTGGTLPAAYRQLKDYENVGLTMTIPIYDWGMGRGKVRMARTDVEITKTQIEQANIEFAHDVRTKVLQFNNQAEQCRTSLRAQDIAAERYDIMKRRFENGAVTVTELNTAQEEFESAQHQYISQLQQFWTDYYGIQKLTLYDFIRKEDIRVNFNDLIK